MATETVATRVSAFGRLADDLTRDTLPARDFEVELADGSQRALKKSDGYFVFTDLEPLTPYQLVVSASNYQRRTLGVTLPTTAPVEVSVPAEDDLFLLVTAPPDTVNNQVTFSPPPFIPTIRQGAAVFGEGGFTAVLQDDLEGSTATFATFDTVTGVSQGHALRIVRSSRLILKPGPYYGFPTGMTLVALKIVENTLGDPPIAGSTITIDRVDGNNLGSRTVGGVSLHTATVGPTVLTLGPDRAIQAVSNDRGDAVFYYPSATPIPSIRVDVAAAGFVSTTDTIAITAGGRTSRTVRLDRV